MTLSFRVPMARQAVDKSKERERAQAISWQVLCALMVIGLATCLGCGRSGDQYPRVPISGTVRLDGEPLLGGYLIFEPKDNQPTQSGGMIKDGKFNVPREAGPVPGLYSVAVFSGAEAAESNTGAGTPEGETAAKKFRGERVPRKYNIDTTLTKEVKADAENVFEFDLSTK